MQYTSGGIQLNARRPQTLASVALIRNNHSPSLARSGPGGGENQRDRERESVRMSEGEEGVSAGRRKREYEMAGEREREVGDCFTNRIPLINHPV